MPTSIYRILPRRNVENFPYFQGNFHYKTYFLDIGGALVIPESSFLISQGTTGLHIWEASSFLAEYFLENANNLFKDGDTILELGAGLGLASFALAKVFNHLKIIVSDFEVSILEILKEICYLNNSSSQIKTCFLDWNNPSISFEALSNDVSSGSFTCVDWIVAADVVYDPELISPFLACISFFFKKNSKLRVILALTTRNPETFDLFISQLPNFHLRVSQYVNFSPKAFTFCPFSLDISNVLILRIEQIVPSSS